MGLMILAFMYIILSLNQQQTKILSEKSVMHVEKSQDIYDIGVSAPVLHIADYKSYSR